MVLAVFAMGYKSLFGYAGLLSLGHALFFAAGLYGDRPLVAISAGACRPGFLAGIAAGALLAVGDRPAGAAHQRRRLHDRDHDVRPGRLSRHPLFRRADPRRRGLRPAQRGARRPRRPLDLSADPTALLRGAGALRGRAARHTWRSSARRHGRVLVAIRENEERSRDARLRHLPRPARRRRRLRHSMPAAAGAAYGCCSAMSARASPRCNIRSCRCSGCCSAARAPRSGRSSARCSCTMSSIIASGVHRRLPARSSASR